MNPMWRVAEATHRVSEVQDIDMRDTSFDCMEVNERTQNEERDVESELRQTTREASQVTTE